MDRYPPATGAERPAGGTVTSRVDLAELERYLHEQIPISAAMGVTVREASGERVRLHAPIGPNINHRKTVFGGSASAVGILAGWSLLHVVMQHGGPGDRIVIQRSSIDYLLPIESDFDAVAALPEPSEWQRFQRMMSRKGLGRVDLRVELLCGEGLVAECFGTYVILAP